MKRRVLALLLTLELLCSLVVLPASAAAENSEAVQVLQAAGVLRGDEKGNLNLDQYITRAQFAAFLIQASKYKDTVTTGGLGYSLFKDVKSTHWASEHIYTTLQEGWMIGYTDGTFRPDQTITLEEACTSVLRLLGYDTATLGGSYPTAQLTKAESIGLRDGVTVARGTPLTRAICAQIMYNALIAKSNDGQIYAASLGYPTTADGKLDYTALTMDNTSGPFIATGEDTLNFTPTVIYRNGVQERENTLKKGEVYYTNAGIKTLWIYDRHVSGLVTDVANSGGAPTSVTLSGTTYSIGTQSAAYKLSTAGGTHSGILTVLLLGMDDEVVDVVSAKGPFTASSGSEITFSPDTVYRNGALADSAVLNHNDIYYTCEEVSSVWIYTDKITGIVDSLSPNAAEPTSVTVSGAQYTIGTSAVSSKFAELGSAAKGSMVTLLFGVDGQIADVITGDDVDTFFYGVVQSSERRTQGAVIQTLVTVFCTDGQEHTFTLDRSTEYEKGRLVSVNLSGGGVKISGLSLKSLSGSVSAGGKGIGDYRFAEDIEILDVNEDGDAAVITPARIAGYRLDSRDVRFYALNEQDEISCLILNNATGDAWSYAYLQDIVDLSEGINISVTYTWLMDGTSTTRTGTSKFAVDNTGGVAMRFNPDGSIRTMRELKSVKLTDLTLKTAMGGNKRYTLAQNVQVYLREYSRFYQVELSDLNTEEYSITGYYDTSIASAGGQIRIIVATKNAS